MEKRLSEVRGAEMPKKHNNVKQDGGKTRDLTEQPGKAQCRRTAQILRTPLPSIDPGPIRR